MEVVTSEVLARVKASLCGEVEASGSVIASGFYLPDGRQIPVFVDPLPTGRLRVSDGGESWTQVWMAGDSSDTPSRKDTLALNDICARHGLEWDHTKHEVAATVSIDDVGAAAKAVIAVAVAIDGWRSLHLGVGTPRTPPQAQILAAVQEAGHQAGWKMKRRPEVRGEIRLWSPAALLQRERGRPGRSFVHFLSGKAYEKEAEHAAGILLDLRNHPHILVCFQEVRANLERDLGHYQGGEFRIVGRSEHGVKRTATSILSAAADIAA